MKRTMLFKALLSKAEVILFLLSLGLLSCQSNNTSGNLLGSEETQQTQLPKLKINLPPPPSFEKEHAPEKYPDSSLSVYGLRKDMEKNLNQQVRVKGFILEIYECPECPKGSECKPCLKPHLWLSDRANGPKDKALMVTDYPKEDPKTRKKITFETGIQYIFSGTFAKLSATGFSSSDGLLVYESAKPANEEE